MFNNAGIGVGGGFELHTIEDWDRVLDVNLKGVVYGVHAAYKIMLDQGFGHIVNTASIAGILPIIGVAAYTVSKFGIVGLTKTLRAEAALKNIRVSLLCPGVVRTPILEGGKHGKLYPGVTAEQQREMWESLKPIPPETFAIKALNSIAKNKAIIIIPSWWKRFWRLDRMFPLLGIRLASKRHQKGMERMS
jgi:NAD(P)-dependent dehydrogenase (short-subunit alcohol dehydrogenase family)